MRAGRGAGDALSEVLEGLAAHELSELAAEMGPAFGERVLARFDETWREGLVAMNQAVQGREARVLRDAAHRVRGAAAMLGAAAVARRAADLEAASARDDWHGAQALLVRFEVECEAAAVALDALFSSLVKVAR